MAIATVYSARVGEDASRVITAFLLWLVGCGSSAASPTPAPESRAQPSAESPNPPSTEAPAPPASPPPPSPAVAIAVSNNATCAILEDGRIQCQDRRGLRTFDGAGAVELVIVGDAITARDGQHGVMSASLADHVPQLVPRRWRDGQLRARSLDASCVVTPEGGVICPDLPSLPTELSGATNVERVVSSSGIVCAIDTATDVRCWLTPSTPSRVQTVAAAHGARDIAVNEAGITTIDQAGAAWTIPRRGSGFAPRGTRIELAGPAVQIARVEATHCFRLENGAVQCVGRRAPSAPITNAESLAASWSHACFLSGGRVSCWGANYNGAIGRSMRSHVPPAATGIRGVRGLSRFSRAFCAQTEGGSQCVGSVALPIAIHAADVDRLGPCVLAADGVECWREIGVAGERAGTPRGVAFAEPIRALASSERITCILLERGSLQCWGDRGGFPAGDEGDHDVPLEVFAPREIASGVTSNLVATSTEVCWVDASGGRCLSNYGLGHGSGLGNATHSELIGAHAIGASIYWTCGAMENGVRCVNASARTRLVLDVPMRATTIGLSSSTTTEADLLCAKTTSGAVSCAQLHRDRAGTPWTVEGIDHVDELAVIGDAACATRDGELWCWGPADELGRTVEGTFDRSEAPRVVLGPP